MIIFTSWRKYNHSTKKKDNGLQGFLYCEKHTDTYISQIDSTAVIYKFRSALDNILDMNSWPFHYYVHLEIHGNDIKLRSIILEIKIFHD